MSYSPMIFRTVGVLCLSFLFVACNKDEFEKTQKELAEINVELRAAKNARNALNLKERELKKLITNLERTQKKEREVENELNEVAEYHQELKSAIEYITALTEKWKVATRKSLIGENIGLVRLSDKTLAGAKIVELDEEKVVLIYSGGQGAFELAELPEAMRKRLLHEPTILLEGKIVK